MMSSTEVRNTEYSAKFFKVSPEAIKKAFS